MSFFENHGSAPVPAQIGGDQERGLGGFEAVAFLLNNLGRLKKVQNLQGVL